MEEMIFLSALGIVSALGRGKQEVSKNLFAGHRSGIVARSDLLVDKTPTFVGQVDGPLPDVPEKLSIYASRNLQLAITAAEEIRDEIETALTVYGRKRIAVILGSSTSGIAEGESAVRFATECGRLPSEFDMRQQELGSPGEALAQYLQLEGPAISVSTACSSGAQALAMGRRLIRTGLADAVLAGGADSLCRLTINGFKALSALSNDICNPFSKNRDGTTIGEGAAIFLMEKREAPIALLGVGTSTDAYSMTAPQPEGLGIESAIRQALQGAGLDASEIDYIHLHGTGTKQNDAMESTVVSRVFGADLPCSSSKGQIGHTLGAAGAMGAAHCWLSATSKDGVLPPHLWDQMADDGLLSKNLVSVGNRLPASSRRILMSNAIAFGGNNAVLILGRECR